MWNIQLQLLLVFWIKFNWKCNILTWRRVWNLYIMFEMKRICWGWNETMKIAQKLIHFLSFYKKRKNFYLTRNLNSQECSNIIICVVSILNWEEIFRHKKFLSIDILWSTRKYNNATCMMTMCTHDDTKKIDLHCTSTLVYSFKINFKSHSSETFSLKEVSWVEFRKNSFGSSTATISIH